MQLRFLKKPSWNKKRKTAKVTEFEQYLETLSEADLISTQTFFTEFDGHTSLARSEKLKLRSDFEKALLYYNSTGILHDEAFSRLSIDNLGGFYVRPPILWYALDNAAKIYPISMKHGRMAVFRMSVYLKSAVVPELIQMALTFTIKRFPTFATTVKKGFFWHYLDTAKRRYSVMPESDIPCRPLKVSRSSSQTFRVLYYRNRISVEYFHILTDGAGGMVFLKTLTAEYLRLLGAKQEESDGGILNINEAPSREEAANEFHRATMTENASGFINKPAVQMSGRISKVMPCRILHFKMDSDCLKRAANNRNTTITAYTLALMFLAGKHATDEFEGCANIQVPVNMRKYYKSDTLRNFSMYCGIRLPLTEITDLDAIIPQIALQLEQKASQQSMSEMINSTERMVSALRYIPLFIKTPLARIVYGYLSDRIFSNTLSNIGIVTMPPGLLEYIESMDFVLGGAQTNRASCAMVSFENTTTLSISKFTADPSFEEKLYELLESDGIFPIVEGSELYGY